MQRALQPRIRGETIAVRLRSAISFRRCSTTAFRPRFLRCRSVLKTLEKTSQRCAIKAFRFLAENLAFFLPRRRSKFVFRRQKTMFFRSSISFRRCSTAQFLFRLHLLHRRKCRLRRNRSILQKFRRCVLGSVRLFCNSNFCENSPKIVHARCRLKSQEARIRQKKARAQEELLRKSQKPKRHPNFFGRTRDRFFLRQRA